ncbi:hypothetical protein F5878DRAFT_664936 [Lentinula raphanica]|uniref:Uncharacterized protein n=1 Tax=Lentinula raphanica TaxID=153919 RepID=A0AA38U8E6_9AGAR|nr:hypothetical protein F5878DRAFT_664936 [Lentinula raphanica]
MDGSKQDMATESTPAMSNILAGSSTTPTVHSPDMDHDMIHSPDIDDVMTDAPPATNSVDPDALVPHLQRKKRSLDSSVSQDAKDSDEVKGDGERAASAVKKVRLVELPNASVMKLLADKDLHIQSQQQTIDTLTKLNNELQKFRTSATEPERVKGQRDIVEPGGDNSDPVDLEQKNKDRLTTLEETITNLEEGALDLSILEEENQGLKTKVQQLTTELTQSKGRNEVRNMVHSRPPPTLKVISRNLH